MPRWTADDIPWEGFLPKKLNPDHLMLVKAAALTEFNAASYTTYLKNVFADDADIAAVDSEWQLEEEQHGRMLGRYAEMADPGFKFATAFENFRTGYVIPVDVTHSVRGSRVGELLARCVVETGTSSFYSAIREASQEPVLRELCRRIAGDEFRHYRMFLEAMAQYQKTERLSLLGRLRVAAGRVKESDDDELAFAWHCGNGQGTSFDSDQCNRAYARRAYGIYRYHHAERAVGMILKASGLPPDGWLGRGVSRWAYGRMQARARCA